MNKRNRLAAPSALVGVVLCVALVASACGGGSSESESAVSDSDAVDSTTTAPESTEAGDGDAADGGAGGDTTADESASTGGSYEPGATEYRAVNLLDVPVDIYVRTTGLVEAYLITEGLAPGAVDEFVAPPERGTFVVTNAGAGDPTCVIQCDHFITELSALPEEGPVRTVLLYNDDFSGPSGYELWEQAPAERIGSTTNAMMQAQSSSAIAVVIAVSVTNADFGLRLATDQSEGCVEPINLENVMLTGGNQTPAYGLEGAASFSLYDSEDRECSELVDGPFAFDGDLGSRTYVFLSGSPGSIEALQVPMTVGEVVDTPAGNTGGSADGGADRDTVVNLMADEVSLNFSMTNEQAGCRAELIVDGIGTDVLYIDGALVDLDALPAEINNQAGAALVESVTTCGIDPTAFDG